MRETPTVALTSPAAATAGKTGVVVGVGLAAGILWLLLTGAKKRKEAKGERALLPLAKEAAQKANLPWWILAGVARKETGWDNSPNLRARVKGFPCVLGADKEVGITQIIPRFFGYADRPAALCDPATNFMVSARILRRLWRKYDQDLPKTLAAYNAGGGAVDKAIRRARDEGGEWTAYIPRSTRRSYVPKGSKYAEEYRTGLAGLGAAPALAARANFMRARFA